MSTETFLPWFDWGVATRPRAGQALSGDLHLVQPFCDGVLVAVVDGLGHGPEAAAAARTAVDLLVPAAHEPLLSLVNRCHQGMLQTRGAAMSLASLRPLDGTLTWVGVGNVEGMLWHADAGTRPRREALLLRGGVVGAHLPPLRAAVRPLTRGDTLLFATDGIRRGFFADRILNEPPQRIAERILAAHATATDDSLVLVARYLGGP